MRIKPLIKFVAVSAFLSLLAVSCKEYKYAIEMEPTDKGLERKLTCQGDFNSVDLGRISKLYPKQLSNNSFVGTFVGELPNDIGGAGFYSKILTEMGTTHMYSERFRGHDDLVANIENLKGKVEKFVDFICGWLDHEFGHDPNLVKLRSFCRNDLKRDVENFVLYQWFSTRQEDSEYIEESSMRLTQYLLERDYLDANDAQRLLYHGVAEQQEALRLIHKVLSKKLGYSDLNSVAGFLSLLADSEKIEDSLQRYFATTDEYVKLWEAKKIEENDPNIEPPETSDFFSEELGLDFELWQAKHLAEVKVKCRAEPFYTNGKWDPNSGKISWSSYLAEDLFLPTFLYCLWSQPDETFQKQHFGKIVLKGEELAKYCSWQTGLDKDKTKDWSGFLSALKPTDSLQDKIQRFRFSDEGKAAESDSAEPARELILSGLKQN